VAANNLVTVKGPKGELSVQIDPSLIIEKKDGQLLVSRPSDQRQHRSLHGLTRSLINNAVVGVSGGYRRELVVFGVGYRSVVAIGVLGMSLGATLHIYFVLLTDMTIDF